VEGPLTLPLSYQAEAVGQLVLGPRQRGEAFTPADRRLLEDLARQVGMAAHAVRLTSDLQRSRERLVTAREEERRRLRRDLHDGLGPALGSLTLQLDTARTLFKRDPAAADARWPSLGLEAHEYFHLFNVKRLRPIELGPFDFEKAPTTGSLWISEGVTSYYSGLLMTRAGLQTPDAYLASLSSLIGNLQTSPGRLLQSVERSSLEVWENSNSGVNPSARTVSYYNKGNVLGLLLDAKIRRATDGRASFDDVMRLAYRRYSGARGFTADDFRRTAEEIAGTDLRAWFASAVSSTDELDYSDVLEWYGLRFVTSSGPSGAWTLERRPEQTAVQRARMASWLEKGANSRPE
jgi:hypothetical protein